MGDMLSNVKLMLKLTHKFSVMVDSTTDSDMLDAHHAPVAVALPAPVTKTIETPCTEVSTEHCVDVPIVKEVVTPVETCHVVTKVICTPAVHSIPKVTCEAGVTEIVEHPVYAHHGAYLG